jgi:uncharacterized membrane protein YdbT with pleckstrin-like domain
MGSGLSNLQYNVGLGTPRTTANPSGPVMVRPSLRLVRPLYYAGFILLAIDAGLINNRGDNAWYGLLVVPVGVLLLTIRLHLKQHFEVLTIGGGRLRYETGMLSKSTRTMDIAKIQDVRVDQSLIQRMLGTGSISIETAGETGGLTMANIDQPQTVADYILEAAGK